MLYLLSTLSFAVSYTNMTIARRGEEPQYTIVVPKVPPYVPEVTHFMYAAKEFQKYVINITGVNLTIKTDEEPLPEKAILIGLTKYTKELCPKLDKFNKDGDDFHWVVTPTHIFLNGGTRGIVYGVYELFQRYGGVRFYSSWMTVVPPAEIFEIPSNYDYYSTPDFYYRESHDPDISGGFLPSREIASKMRMDSGESQVNFEHGGSSKLGAGAHTIIGLMQWNGQCAFNQAYVTRYGLVKEGTNENDISLRTKLQPCLTEPANLDSVVKCILNNLPAEQNSLFTEISQCDGDDWCHCRRCIRAYMGYGNHSSGLWIHFLNQVYDRIAPQMNAIRPKKTEFNIRTLAYVNTLLPPKNIQVNPHIFIRLCLYKNDNSLPLTEGEYEGSIEFLKALKGWTALSKKVIIWMYIDNDNRAEIIHPSWFQIPEDIKTFHKYGVWGIMFGKVQPLQETYVDGKIATVGRLFGDFDRMKAYINTILTWNTSLRTNDVINDFLRGYYGPKAAPYIRQYLDDGYREVKAYPNHKNLPLHVDMGSTYQVYPPLRTKEFFEHGQRLWQRAIEVSREDYDPRFAYNTITGSISHGMSVYHYYNTHPVSAVWSEDKIVNNPDPLMKQISKNIPEACPHFFNPDPRSNRLCYLGGEYGTEKEGLNFRNIDWIARNYFNFLANDVKPDLLHCGNVKFGSKGGYFSGRGGLLLLNGWNYLDYNTGGFDFNNMPILYALDQSYKENFTTVSATPGSNSYKFDELFYRRGWPLTNLFFEITKTYTPSGNGVKGRFTLQYKHTKDFPTHNLPQDKTINTVATVSCKLDNSASEVAWKTSDEKWMKSKLLPQLTADLVGFKNNARNFIIASPISKRAMKFDVNRDPESVSIEMNRTSKVLTVYIAFNDPPTMNLNAAEITITPIESIDIPSSAGEKVNEYFKGTELSTEEFTNMDQGYNTLKYKFYVGGDEKSYSGRAYISEFKFQALDAIDSNPFLIIDKDNKINGYPHLGDTYNFSAHIRCDVSNPNEDSFSFFTMYNPKGGPKAKNAAEYSWYTLQVKNLKDTQKFYLHALRGATKCYVDKIRFIPIKSSDIPYVPPRIQKFEFKELPPMKYVDMYQINEEWVPPSDTLNGSITQASIIVLSVFFTLGAVVIIGAIVYKKIHKDDDERSQSEISINLV